MVWFIPKQHALSGYVRIKVEMAVNYPARRRLDRSVNSRQPTPQQGSSSHRECGHFGKLTSVHTLALDAFFRLPIGGARRSPQRCSIPRGRIASHAGQCSSILGKPSTLTTAPLSVHSLKNEFSFTVPPSLAPLWPRSKLLTSYQISLLHEVRPLLHQARPPADTPAA